ncbi:MAG: phosphomannose isomerase type II C-terminal cupin domain [Candidatus Omnitrophica bacterium]|nr:phosphomannose isomerase type II C-terminal cupin domain [Candidatus Omnitrophota bacterium]
MKTTRSDPMTVRPWGNYVKLFQENGLWVKRVEVKPGARLSLQKHACRSEKWNIVRGHGYVMLNGRKKIVGAGSVLSVPVGAIHRIANTGKKKLVFIEVAVAANGGKLSEKDIVRLEDDYARAASPVPRGGTSSSGRPASRPRRRII